MAVGKNSILRAANARSKTTETVLVPAAEVMEMVQFMTNKDVRKVDETRKNKPVPIKGEMPVYLL